MAAPATPPAPDSLPIVGNAYAFARDPVTAFERWRSAGDVVRIQAPGLSTYVVTDPELIEAVLETNHDSFTVGPNQRETFAGLEDDAVTVATDDRWQTLRRALAPAFTREKIERYGDQIPALTATLVDGWADGTTFELQREMRILTVNLLADAMLGVDAGGSEDVVMDAADALVARSNFRRPGQLLPDWVPTPTDRRFERAVAALDAYVDDIIDRRREDPGADVCSLLLAAHERGEITLPEVRDNVVALLLAGHESPSHTLTLAWYLLSEHADVYDSLAAEYDAVVDGDHPSADDFDALERTRHVVAETLRLYPPTAGVTRQATEPVTLGDYEFPAGAQFLLPQWIPHRDVRFWDDPETFDPARWQADSDRPDYAYFPFSGGPRYCVGMQFARWELTLALATMVGRCSLDVDVDEPLTFTPSVSLRPEQTLTATVERR